jgi:hypothetical protein
VYRQRFIQIVHRPDGEAPKWVRDAWIGAVLPLLIDEPVTIESVGVLTGPRSWWGLWWHRLTGRTERMTGYEVNAAAAVVIVAARSPEAARWWREHVPHMLDGVQSFLFDLPACQLLD